MNPFHPPPAAMRAGPSGANLDARVQRELLNLLYRDQPLALVAGWLCAALIGTILGVVRPSVVPWSWTAAITLVLGFRLLLALRYRRTPVDERDAGRWETRLLIGSLVTGAGWGFIGWYAFPIATPMLRAVVLVLISGTIAGASRTLACHAPSFWCYILLSAIPLLIRMFHELEPSAVLLAMLTMFYVVMMLGLGGSFRRTVAASFRLQFENADLAERLSKDIEAREAAESALRTSEESLRLAHYALDRAHDPVALVDREGHFVYVSEALCRLSGRSAHELETTPAWDGVFVLPREDFELYWDHVKRTGVLTFETTIRGRNGVSHDVEVSASYIEFNGHEAVCTISRDLAPRRAAEQEKTRLQQQLQETQRLESLGVLAGGMAHDFNNLLTAILGNATMARENLGDGPAVTDMLTQIEKASNQAAGLCRQMLAYAGRGQLTVEPIDLSALVTDTARLLEMSAGRHTRLKLELTAGLPRVLADASQLRQIVLNLVHNAAEAIIHTHGEIVVSTRAVQIEPQMIINARVRSEIPEGEGVEVTVRDNGSGISPQTLDRIFEPFFTTKSSGRGLGLAAVLGIVRSHHALLHVESSVGRGTTFRVVFAATATNANQQMPAARASAAPASGRVLVIDDDDAVRRVACQVLERLGLDVEVAADGDSALALCNAAADRFNLLLVDMTMPGKDGLATLLEMRKRGARAPAILMSGFSELQFRENTDAERCVDFLQKPFDLLTFRSKVESALANGGRSKQAA